MESLKKCGFKSQIRKLIKNKEKTLNVSLLFMPYGDEEKVMNPPCTELRGEFEYYRTFELGVSEFQLKRYFNGKVNVSLVLNSNVSLRFGVWSTEHEDFKSSGNQFRLEKILYDYEGAC